MVLAGCREEAPPAPPAGPGPSVQLALDGAARRVAISQPIALTRLVDAAPSTWLEVRAETDDGRALELPSPSTTYPDREVRLYLDEGRPALGVFPPITADMPPDVAARARQPTATLAPISRVSVTTHRVDSRPPLTIVIDGAEHALTADQLDTLLPATGGPPRAQGWPLADVIGLAAGSRTFRTVRIVADEDLTLGTHALRAPQQQALLRLNHHGEYVFRVWESGRQSPTYERHHVTKIVLQ